MQPAKDRIGMDGIRFSAAMTRSWVWVVKIGERRIRDTGAQGHMWTRPIVMGNPRFQAEHRPHSILDGLHHEYFWAPAGAH
jgi:hypothetical protein